MNTQTIVNEKEDLSIEKMTLEKDVMTIKDQLETADERAGRDPKYGSDAWRIRARDSMTYKKRRITEINIRLSQIKRVLRDMSPDQTPSDSQEFLLLKNLARKVDELLKIDSKLSQDSEDERMHDRFDMKMDEVREVLGSLIEGNDGVLL